MRQFTSQELQDKFEALPTVLKEAVTSNEIHDKIEMLAKKYNLHIDQLGELMDEIGLVLLNLHSSSDFVANISQRLNISTKLSYSIAQDVNTEIFDSIKDLLQKDAAVEELVVAKEQSQQTISSLERVGGFSVERESPESSAGVTSADRPQILAGLENPPSNLPGHTGNPPTNLPTENHSEPLVDYLLSNPAGRAAQNTTVSAPTAPTATTAKKPVPPIAPQVPKNDPYKESI